MSSPYCNNDVAFPHAGLLAYFHQPNGIDSCDESAQTTRGVSTILNNTKHKLLDEEAQCDFWDTVSTTDTDCDDLCWPEPRRYQGVFHSLYDFWTFVCVVILASCAVLFGLDMALGRYGMGMSLTDCIMGRHLPPPPMTHELHLCLASPNREAPGAQTWRLMSSRPHDNCTTELVTLLVSPSEGWKLRPGDSIVFGEEQRLRSEEIRIDKFLGGDALLRQRDLGDNIAEEGVLSQSGEESAQTGVIII